MSNDPESSVRHFHEYPSADKIRIQATKPMTNQRGLALAYSTGIATRCKNELVDINWAI
jgi:malate dehydrogenase (oxaloacetate-decarboxylating)(NADP+)